MSLFQCAQCGCRENTATCNYWDHVGEKGAVQLCSACDPDIGKWHDSFDRLYLPKGMFITGHQGNLYHKLTGEPAASFFSREEFA